MVSTPHRPTLRRAAAVYFTFAHATLALAGAVMLLQPHSFVGFYYHAKMLTVVHLVALGWIGASILGAVHVALAQSPHRPAGSHRFASAVAWVYTVVALGIPAHFWIEELSGVGWSGSILLLIFGRAAWLGSGLVRAGEWPRPMHACLALGSLNLLGAVSVGILLAVNKIIPFVPGRHLDNVHAHLHLAAVGGLTMLGLGMAYRSLPNPPGTPIDRHAPTLTAGLLQAGVLGLAIAFHFGGRGLVPAAALVALAVCIGMGHVHRAVLRRADPLTTLALVYLALAAALGVALAALPTSLLSLRLASAYGVCGLLGFLGQLVAGAGLDAMPRSVVRWSVRASWIVAVPALALGFHLENPWGVRVGGLSLCLAALLGTLGHAPALRRFWREHP